MMLLELLGISDLGERKLFRDELYAEMTKLYREIRATEKKMQRFRAQSARHGRPSPLSLADEIWEDLAENPVAKSLGDFVLSGAALDTLILPSGKAKTKYEDMFNPNSLQFGGYLVPLGSHERVDYGRQLSKEGHNGSVHIPIDPTICETALHEYQAQADRLTGMFTDSAAAITTDEKMQERIVKELWRKASQK
jgi:hypothetical protein